MINTKRCTIKRFSKEHVELFNSLVTNNKVREYLGGVPSKEHIDKRINRILENTKNDYWVVQDNETGESIGLITINKQGIFNKGEISYEFLPNWWGKGYAVESIKKVIEHTFSSNKYKKLVAITQTKNVKSKKLLESIGMQFIKTKVMFEEEQSIYHLKKNQVDCV